MDVPTPAAPTAPEGTGGSARVVVGVDRSPSSRDAFVHALTAAASRGADVEVVSTYPVPLPWAGGSPAVVPDPETLYAQTVEGITAFVDEVRRDPAVAAIPGAADVRLHAFVSEGPASAVLLERSADADLLVVGSRGRGAVHTALLGSVALHCVTNATCPVVVVHPSRSRTAPEPAVVVGVDGSDHSRAALVTALMEARRLGGPVEVVATYEGSDQWTGLYAFVPPSFDGIRTDVERGARAMVDEVVREVWGPDSGAEVRTVVLEGAASDVLVERSRRAHLLVIGSRGRGGVRGLLLGSVALRCLVSAACPVMVVPNHRQRIAERERERAAMAGR